MAVDFEFDGTFNENEEGEPEEDFEEYEDEEEDRPRRSPLRLILLLLVVLVMLCVVCGLVVRSGLLPFSIPGVSQPPPPPPPVQDTPAPEATEEEALPPEGTEEAQPETTESTEGAAAVIEPTEEALPGPEPTEETQPTVEPTEEALPAPESTEEAQPTVEPTEETMPAPEPTDEAQPTTEPTEEPTEPPAATEEPPATTEPTATTVPVPGPTATPGPTQTDTATSCDNNVAPTADPAGPYTAMRGKGVAIVEFVGEDSVDPDGTIVSYEWDFGDGSPLGSGESVTHGYNSTGSYVVTLTVTDNCGATDQVEVEVTITGPTPPANGDCTPTPPASVTPVPTPTPADSATLGFCYRVQYGDTLSGLAWRFGVPWEDLARVNGVRMGYFVIAGQGLFIPTGEIGQGPNVYQVQADDTLNKVAFHCGLTTITLAQANGLAPDKSLSPGQMLTIPLWKP